jgi:hypothetical protein
MNLTPLEKADFALELKSKVNDLYFREGSNSDSDLSYADVCRITDMMEMAFRTRTKEFPKIIEGACLLARALRNPDKVQTQEHLRKGLGLLLLTAGGFSIICSVLGTLSIWTVLGVVLAAHVPFLLPIALLGGLAAAVSGIYTWKMKQTPQALSAKAHNLLLEAISNWADTKAAVEKDKAAESEARRTLAISGSQDTSAMGQLGKLATWPFRTVADFVDQPTKIKEPTEKNDN